MPVRREKQRLKNNEATRTCRRNRIQQHKCQDCGIQNEKSKYTRCYTCREKHNTRGRKWVKEHRGARTDYAYAYNRGLFDRILKEYGGKCTCCGESNPLFLCIDHVNNDGSVERKAGLKGGKLYNHIINMQFPDRYTILCFNCNFGKHINNNICPHKEITRRHYK